MLRCLLKLVVLLVCVQGGEGRRLPSLMDQRGPASPPPTEQRGGGESNEENNSDNGERSESVEQLDILPAEVLIRSRRSSHGCGLRSVLLQVRDLGLGYDADETILFKYCSGACPRVRSNHDLTLGNLLLRGALPDLPADEGWQNGPCCRPTHHEDLAFLDNDHHWHRVEKLSAAGCTCVG
ncbi:hypothetical protein UPYG_G00063280 [Umbra pygmaea]|uniref:TGF-beta family profile domain-containing protein n=1 Tax=Umbra pygmaea TaxID=75934 RepID=A0ABD0XDI1_UMBPY